jgi:hypothetical protein
MVTEISAQLVKNSPSFTEHGNDNINTANCCIKLSNNSLVCLIEIVVFEKSNVI